MEQIYNFEKSTPPILTERMLREELEKRNLKKQILLIRITTLILYVSIVILGICIMPYSVLLGGGCIAFSAISIIGNVIVSIVFEKHKVYMLRSC